jgi:hypothetical protein
MELVISAINRQIKLEEAKLEKRNRMLATARQIVHSEPLPNANPQYIEQLKKAVRLLTWDIEALDCLVECQRYHQGGHSEIGHKIKSVIAKALPN